MKTKSLYIYTFPAYQSKGWIKVGDAFEVEKRVRQQMGTSNPEKEIILEKFELPEGSRDHDIHKILEEQLGVERITDGYGKEWFIATVADVRRAVNIKRTGKNIDAKPLELHTFQKRDKEKILNIIEDTKKIKKNVLIGHDAMSQVRKNTICIRFI